MKFSNGVYAMVILVKEPGYSHYYGNSRAVYDKLESYVGHDEAAEAEGWTEMACVGQVYEQDEFTIEMVEV